MINFPINPTLGQQYTSDGRTWECSQVGPPAVWDQVPIGTSDVNAAGASALLAKDWATKTDGEVVVGQGRGAKYYSDLAASTLANKAENADLANTADAAKGAGRIGFTFALAYAAGTLGSYVKSLVTLTGLATAATVAIGGYSVNETQNSLDFAKTLQDYTALRAYTANRALGIRITTRGIAGDFQLDTSDTTTADDGGTVIVDSSLRRWKRIYDGAVDVKWFGAVGDGVANDTTALQAALTASKSINFGRSSNTYRVTAALTPQSGADLQFNGALLVQATANTQIFNLDGLNSIRAVGGRFQGAGDFNNTGGLRSAFRGIAATDVFISGCRFTNFGDTALTITAANNVFFVDNVVVGPAGIVAGDGTCAGVLIGDGCTNVQVRGNHISNTCQGITSGKGCTGVVVSGNNIHDIIGQHGVYMGAGHVNLTINGNTITTVAGQGIKVQNVDTHAFDAIGISIFGNTIKGTGSHGIIVVNTTASPVQLLRDVTIIGNTINTTALDDGISLTACSGAVVDGNTINGANRDGIRFSSCDQLVIAKNIVRAARNNGMREQLACSNVSITGNHVIDCCIADTTAEEQGIYVLLGTNYTITDNIVRDSGAHMRYGIQSASANQATFVVARNVVSGATDYGARFAATGTNMLYYGENVFSGVSGEALNAPATDQRGNRGRRFYGTAAPTAGAWLDDDVLENSTTSAASPITHWICTAAGTPGTWRASAWLVFSGNTAGRPTLLANAVGVQYLDTTLAAAGKPITWNGANWVDATGATV